MMKFNLFIILVLCASAVYPSVSISRWFSASYADLRFALRRYGYCVGGLGPIRDHAFNDTEYLINTMRIFLDQANYDNEQLANVTLLMDNICHPENESEYPISVNIDVRKYNSTAGKENRCRSIDEALDAMYPVFKRAAYNKSEPLDFSIIHFYPNPSATDVSYNLTDLINTSWIKSDTQIEHICKFTGSIKDYVQQKSRNSTAQERSQQQLTAGVFNSFFDLMDRIFLEPFIGYQRRLLWESTNRFEVITNRLGYMRGEVENQYKAAKNRLSSMLWSSATTNSTAVLINNNLTSTSTTTTSKPNFNSTISPLPQTRISQASAIVSSNTTGL